MAILLKEQLRILNEGVHYRAPLWYGSTDNRKQFSVFHHSSTDVGPRAISTTLFYDFYAMELMHRLIGSPVPDPEVHRNAPFDPDADDKAPASLTKQQKKKFNQAYQKSGGDLGNTMLVPNWANVEEPPHGTSIVPARLREVVDQVYEEVVIQISDKIMTHLRLTLILELRHIIGQSSALDGFRHRLVTIYNKNEGKISNEEFAQTVSKMLPQMVGHEDSVKRLLKFCKYYQSMSSDPADSIPSEPEVEPQPDSEEPKNTPEEPEVPKSAEEPDDTDYNMPPVEIPQGADWGDEPYKYSDEVEKEKMMQWLKTHKNISEGNVSGTGWRMKPNTIKSVRQAINKSGLTWNDVLLAFTNISWNDAFGGQKWGEGAKSYIQLVAQNKTHNVEDMTGIVDHIYDLQHNTGALLNKGGMYVAPEDLNRRSHITHLAMYLDDVSPLIKRLILRVLPYVSPHPEIDKNPKTITDSPIAPMPSEIAAILTASKFTKSAYGEEWITQAPFADKHGNDVQNSYTAKYHTNGMYSIEDTMNTDIQVFETPVEFEKWVKQNANNFVVHSPGTAYYSAPKTKSELEAFLETKVKIKLTADKETILLEECKMGWRPSNSYYKAYLPDDDRFKFYAFDDGTFMGYVKSTNKIGGIFYNWPSALSYCKAQTVNALPNQEYEMSKAWIGKAAGSVPPPEYKSTPPPASSAPELALGPAEISMLQNLASSKGTNVTIQPTVVNDGGVTEFLIPYGSLSFNVLSVGKSALAGTGVKYFVQHNFSQLTTTGNNPNEKWTFPNFNQTYEFINKNWEALIQTSVPVAKTVDTVLAPSPTPFSTSTHQSSEISLPPPSPSKATYKAHLGIAKPPTHSIRLTSQDEELLKNIGFMPKMIGGDVWYMHQKLQDVVKFFPNDQAKIILPQGNTKATVTKKIEDAIPWLISKYSGATMSPIVAPAAPSTVGSKAGMLYEKTLTSAGFEWYSNLGGEYFNKTSGDTVKIFPYPKSTYKSGSTGATKTFNSLPELAIFVKGLPNPASIPSSSSTGNKELDNIIKNEGFVYKGTNASILTFTQHPLNMVLYYDMADHASSIFDGIGTLSFIGDEQLKDHLMNLHF